MLTITPATLHTDRPKETFLIEVKKLTRVIIWWVFMLGKLFSCREPELSPIMDISPVLGFKKVSLGSYLRDLAIGSLSITSGPMYLENWLF